MRILVLNKYCWKHPYAGGAEVRLREIFSRLAKKGHDVKLLCAAYPSSEPLETADGIGIRRIGFNRLSYFWLFFSLYPVGILSAIYAILRWKPDVVIDDASPTPWFAALYCRPLRVRCALQMHHVFRDKWFALHGAATAMLGIASEATVLALPYNKRIAVSAETAQRIGAGIVPNGVKEAFFKVLLQRKRGDYFVYSGQMQKRKRIHLLLNAAKELTDTTFYLIGNGPEKNRLRELARAMKLRNVKFLGALPDKKAAALIGKAKAFVSASELEGFGLSCAEANACGTPVVAFESASCGAVKDGETGILVKTYPAFIAALKAVQNGRMRFSPARCRRWAARFNWDDAALKFERVVETW
jgi:glycosyltransferase involved in cell wall biosynthesis